MSVETHRVLMGTCGWKHTAWLDSFYSEDLPEDWQLGFYSNEFSVVYVKSTDWISDSGEAGSELYEWKEEVSDSFRFILEIPAPIFNDASHFKAALSKAENLAELCLGIVIQLNSDSMSDIQEFHEKLGMAQSITNVCVETCGNALSDEYKQLLLNKNVTEVINGKSTSFESVKHRKLVINRIMGDELDMKELRSAIETCLAAANENCVSVLCVDGEPPSLEVLRNADTILNLL